MDWDESEELREILEAEVDERTARLVEGAQALSTGMLAADDVEGLVRDGHTLKGSANMMGRLELGAAGAALERGWRHVGETGIEQPPDLADALDDVARSMPGAVRDSALLPGLGEAVVRLTEILDREEQEAEEAPGAPTPPVVGPPVEPEVPVVLPGPAELPDHEAEPRVLSPIPSATTLGGLLGSVEQRLHGEITRVDTGQLYRLINRTVELDLDASALRDLTRIGFERTDPEAILAAWKDQIERLASAIAELQDEAVGLADTDFSETFDTFPQLVRFVGRRLGKEVRFRSETGEILVDRQIVDLLREPLRHLVVNAVDHGIEEVSRRLAIGKPGTGTVELRADVDGERLRIVVSDDGAGIDWGEVARVSELRGLGTSQSELRSNLFRMGFTTRLPAGDFSGSGEGLALVADAVDRIGGSVSVSSERGLGTTVSIDVPSSLVLQSVVIVASGSQFFGLSEPAVVGSGSLESIPIRMTEGLRELQYEGEAVPLVSFAEVVGVEESEPETEVLFISTRSGTTAVTVNEVIDRRNVAVKSLGPILDGAEHLVGAAFLGGGQVLVVVDHHHLGEYARADRHELRVRPRVLVVDDSAGVRQLLAATLRTRGFIVDMASNARDAAREMAVRPYDVLVVDYSMPRSSGVQFVRAVRKAGARMPIVMVSAVAKEDEKAAAWEAGVDAYLDKFDVRQGALTDTIQRLLGEPEQERRA